MNGRKKWLAVVLCGALIIATCINYGEFISKRIYEESSNHLVEVYSHVDHAFTSLAERNWNLLSDWSGYVTHMIDTNDQKDLKAFVKQGRETWGYTEFYFLDGQGNYSTVDGEKGVLHLNHQLTSAATGGDHAVINGTLSTGESVTVFAKYIPAGNYLGLDYGSIALSYNNEAMEQVMDMSAFDHNAGCYVVTPEGNTLFSSEAEESDNYITYLEQEAEFIRGDADSIRAGMAAVERGVAQYQLHGVEYYMAYLPVMSQDWMLLGVVPVSVVNENINQVQWVTIALVGGISLVAAALLLAHLKQRMLQSLHQRDIEIQYRDQLFRTLVQNTNDVFMLLPADTLHAEYVSPNVEDVLGLSPETLREDIQQLIHTAADQEQHYSAADLAAIPLDGSRTDHRLRFHQKTGERRWYRETLYHLMIEDMEKYVLVMSDQTVERQNRAQLEQALDIAKSANEAKSSFLSNMSHDIRTPMNAIMGFTRLLERDASDPDKVLTYTHKISSASNHLLNLINDILDMSKIESGKTSLNVTEFRLGELLEGLDTVIRQQARAKGQEFNIRVRKVQHDKVLGDRMRINQILLNLLSNAVKYTQEGGDIELFVTTLPQKTRGHSCLRFQVKDNGFGMSPEFLKTIFDPFSREQNSTTSGIQGTGLGMAITKNLVELMGGTISVESQQGEGSTFVVELELRTVEETTEPAFWAEHGIARMLVLDDEEDLCRNIQYLLADSGMEIQYATNVEDGIEQINALKENNAAFDLLLLDWTMPGTSGAVAVEKIRDSVDGDTTPILIFSSHDWSDLKDEALSAGANGFLSKPFFISTLQQAVCDLRAAEEDTTALEELGPMLEGLHILAAEDNKINAEILAEMLDIDGATCDLAENGQIALEKFQTSAPGTYSVILMDVQMPVMGGYDATRAIRACGHPEAQTIPIIAMTANAYAEDVRQALDSGMDAHIAKPLDMELLAATARKLLAEGRDGMRGGAVRDE